jgi:hypothetical protein
MPKYYQLAEGREACESPQWNWADEFRAENCCQSCGFLFKGDTSANVSLKYFHGTCPTNTIGVAQIGIIRDDLLIAIGRKLFEKYFLVGSVHDEMRNATAACCSFIGKQIIQIGGDRSSSFRFCTTCNRPAYLALGTKYVLARDVAENSPLYHGNPTVVMFRQDVMARVADVSSEFQFIELPIREEPLDGLPLSLLDTSKDLTMNQWKPRKKRRRGIQ